MIIFDSEIKKAILGKGEKKRHGVEYCKGWNDHVGMGISCICTFDTIEEDVRVFLDDNINEFQGYIDEQYTCGFYSKRFDNKLLKAHGITVNPATHFDFWEIVSESAKHAGEEHRKRGSLSLDALSTANFPGTTKNEHGALMPIYYQTGDIGKLITYCIRDVQLLANLIMAAIQDGGNIINPRCNEPLPLNAVFDEMVNIIMEY